MDWLIGLDERLLLAINGCHCAFMDFFMMTVTGKFIWIPFYCLLAVLLYRERGAKDCMVCLVMIALMITAVDQTCSSLIRPAVERLRPSSILNPLSEEVHLVNGYRGGSFGFPSAHAANTMALAVFLIRTFGRRYLTALLLGWSLLVAYSRVYLGVHYPGDILAGFLIGSAYAVAFSRGAEWLARLDLKFLKAPFHT